MRRFVAVKFVTGFQDLRSVLDSTEYAFPIKVQDRAGGSDGREREWTSTRP